MTYKYSICHPDKENIEYFNHPISGNQVIEIAKNYPWLEKLELSDSLTPDNTHYNPSLDFNCLEDGKSFCLTANYDKNQDLEFSLWYNRPKKVKVLFGLFGEKEKLVVDDIWGYDLEKSLTYLEHFVKGNYSLIEELYEK